MFKKLKILYRLSRYLSYRHRINRLIALVGMLLNDDEYYLTLEDSVFLKDVSRILKGEDW